MLAVVVLGTLAQAVAWAFVASGRAFVWTIVAPTIAFAGIAAVLTAPPPLSGDLPLATAVSLGVASGVALYAATRAFVAIVVVRRWRTFERHAVTIYRGRGAGLGLGVAAGAAAVALGEEVFWRGVTYRELSDHLGAPIVAALATLGVYVAVNAVSRNLAIVAAAVVGGAVWGALGWASAGVLASILAHAAWTALMLLWPVVGEQP